MIADTMTGTYEFDPVGDLLILRIAGAPVPERALELLEEARKDPRYHPGIQVLIDRRGLSELPSDAYTATILASISSGWRAAEVRRWAILTSPGAAFGIARMLDLRAALDGVVVGTFQDEGDARRWLAPGATQVPRG